jgi:two-component system response regulator AtoC
MQLDRQGREEGGREDDDSTALTLSPAMRDVNSVIDKVAGTDATVLVWGESGVGKELVARAVHRRSPRYEHPFIKVNCAALPAELLESELFGFDRGAFTGAHRAKPGKFELANTGTIFLDEIGEMPLSLQAKLLQVLQDGQFSRLGSEQDVRVDVRVVAATNKDLQALVRARAFRTDLYYRLAVVSIQVPPLRERREEIPVLVTGFLDRYARRYGRPARPVSPEVMARLVEYSWPGNVRQLENIVERMVVLDSDFRVLADLIEPVAEPVQPAPPPPYFDDVEIGGLKQVGRRAARDAERLVVEQVLHRVRWNRMEASRQLQINYKTLLQKIRELGLDQPRSRRPR